MKKSRFTESKIISILKEADSGIPIQEVCRNHGISSGTYYNWKTKYGGMGLSHLKKLKDLESENSKLKRMYADLSLENEALKDLLTKKL